MKAPSKLDNRHWDWPDGEWLEDQCFVRGKTITQIARELGCAVTTVSYWMRKLGVDVEHLFPEGEIHSPIRVGNGSFGTRCYGWSKEWLEQQYVDQYKSVTEIADELEITRAAVCLQLQKFDIPRRTKNWADQRRERLERAGRSPICSWCGETEKVHVHHIDHDLSNANLDNLAWRCDSCNRLDYLLWALEQSGRATVKKEGREIEVTFNM